MRSLAAAGPLLAALALASAPAAAQLPRVELAGGATLAAPEGSGVGTGWRAEGAIPAAGRLPLSLVVGGGSWAGNVSRAGDAGGVVRVTGERRSSFGEASLRLERAAAGYLPALAAGLAVHSTRAELSREAPFTEEELRAMERDLGGLAAGPTLALTLVRRPLVEGALLADLTLRRGWVPGVEPWELTAGLTLRLGRAGPRPPRPPRAPPGAAAPVRRPPDALLSALEGAALAAGFEVVDADDGWRVVVAGDAFASASAQLPAGARAALGELGAILSRSSSSVRVIGHTDHTGSERVNQRLSERRALAVLDALLAGGLDPLRASALGYGSALPRAPGESPAGRAANRRVELVVSDG